MQYSFTNILVPVDCTPNADYAIGKALEIVEQRDAVIHLVHVARSALYLNGFHLCANLVNPSVPKNSVAADPEVYQKLETLKQTIQKTAPCVKVNVVILPGGNIQQRIVDTAREVKAQLIIVAKSRSHKWYSFFNAVDTSFIAAKSNTAVLTVRPGTTPHRIKSVVLPVRSFVPDRKIELLAAVTRKHKPTIHLVTMHTKQANTTSVFVNTYRMISEYMRYPVDYRVLDGNNFPRAIFDYAKSTEADMLLVNPYTESRINSLYGTDICDVIPPTSNLAVLTAEPSGNIG